MLLCGQLLLSIYKQKYASLAAIYIERHSFREAGVILWFCCADDSFIQLKMLEHSCEIPKLKTSLFSICLTHCSSR